MSNAKLAEVIKENDELKTYKAIQEKIAATIDGSNSGRDIAALSKQLREVTQKIAELEAQTETDEIGAILESRKAAGLPGSVRNKKRQAI